LAPSPAASGLTEGGPTASGPSEPETPLADPPAPEPRPVAAHYDDTDTGFIQTRSSFAHEPLFRPRRSLIKITTYAAVVFALLISAAIAAVTWYGLPEWVPFANQNFGSGAANLQLAFPQNQVNRHVMPNGAEFISVSGKVNNIGKERLAVPPLRIVLRDGNKNIVYTEDVVAPKSQLNPGESVTVNEAILDAPKTAGEALVGWKPN
jgi:hypothetical protein